MGELEDQIARLAAARAGEVPAYRPPIRLDDERRARRTGRLLAAVAAALALVIGFGTWLAWPQDEENPSITTPTSPTTDPTAPTTPSTAPTTVPVPVGCPEVPAATTAAKSGDAILSTPPEPSRIFNVQVQASDCVDEVSFTFANGSPEYLVEYRPGPFSLNPMGKPVAIDGNAFLIVRLRHAEGARLDLPKQFRPGAPSGVVEVREVEDFEAQVTWVLGLDARRPFTVTDQALGSLRRIAVRFPRPALRGPLTCQPTGARASVTVPAGWYVELTDEFHCLSFGPSWFDIERNSDSGVPVSLGTSATATAPHLVSGQPSVASSTTRTIVVDGRRATVIEGTWSGVGLYPAGIPFLYYEIEWGAAGYLTIGTTGYLAAAFDIHKRGVEAIAASARYVP